VSIGANSAIGAYLYLGGQGGIRIGDNVIMGPRVNFHSENHKFDDIVLPIRLQGETRQGIVIEDDCWVGAGTIFLDGSYLEKGCVVVAGSVVNKTFPAFSIIGGVPAKLIRSQLKNVN
jgi:acetyltransferase-like isoleucine patch superfamily enzyme